MGRKLWLTIAVLVIASLVTTILACNHFVNNSNQSNQSNGNNLDDNPPEPSSNITYSAYLNHTWTPENQTIDPGRNLTLEVWITLYEDGNLTIVAKINDDSCFGVSDSLGLEFMNSTLSWFVFYKDGHVGMDDNISDILFPVISPFGPHKVVFEPEEPDNPLSRGTYIFTIEFKGEWKLPDVSSFIKPEAVIRVSFLDSDGIDMESEGHYFQLP